MEIYWDDDGQLAPEQLEILNRAALLTIEFCDFQENCEVSISFVDKDEIQTLNRDYRNKDTATDVLSFPVNNELAMGPSISLGDIAICIEIAQKQAEEYGHSQERELAFLVVHGMLHLLGYDHETPEDETEMCAAQEQILKKLGLQQTEQIIQPE